jgi:hypothetical protein
MANEAAHYVDLSTFPPDEQEHVMAMAKAHNLLAVKVEKMGADLDGISGSTPEAKQEVHQAMGWVRRVLHLLHSKRFNMLYGSIQVWLVLQILKWFGVAISPEQASRLIDAGIKVLEKVAG